VSFGADGFNFPHDLMDDYFVEQFSWDWRLQFGIYFQWVPYSALLAGYLAELEVVSRLP
jgi:hypothetical protein